MSSQDQNGPSGADPRSTVSAGEQVAADEALTQLGTAHWHQQWYEVLELAEKHWRLLLKYGFEEIQNALGDVPEDAFVSYPRARTLSRIICPGREIPADTRPHTELGLADATLQMIDTRLRGEVAAASKTALASEARAERAMGHEIQLPAAEFRVYFEQAGSCHLLAGEVHHARRCLTRISSPVQESISVGQRRDVLGKLALIAAVTGHMHSARGLVETADPLPRRTGWLHDLAESTLKSSAALARVEALDPTSIQFPVTGIGAETSADEFWFAGRLVETRWALAWGEPAAVLSNIREDRRERITPLSGDSLAATVITACEVRLLLALGQPEEAAQLLAATSVRHPMLQVNRARLQLSRDEPWEALAELAPILHTVHPWLYARMEGLILAANARHRLGHSDEVAALLGRALAMGQADGMTTPWASLDPEVPAPVQSLDGLAPVLERLRTARTRPFPTPKLTRTLLSTREWQVLTVLSQGLTFEEAARRQYVSRNTIKTQVRSIYRKLGVASLPEAIAKGYELGLIE